MTSQARRVRDGLKALGLQHRTTRERYRDFSVRTDGNGRTGWDNAYATIYSRSAVLAVAENARRLADEFGLSVTIYRKGLDVLTVLVSSRHPSDVHEVVYEPD